MTMLTNAARGTFGFVTGAAREVVTLAIAWAGGAVAIFGAAYILGWAATGEEPGACTGPALVSGIPFALPTLISITVAGATILVGGYWSLGLRQRPLRVAMVAVSLAASIVALNAGGLITGCA